MTREHKLALIVGFSLILLVGVLISDHLSRARQAQIGPVTSGETQIAQSPLPAPIDPLRAIENAPRPASIPVLIPEPAPAETLAQTPPAPDSTVSERSTTQALLGGGGNSGLTSYGTITEPPVLEPRETVANLPQPPAPQPQPGVEKPRPQMPTRQVRVAKADADQDLIRMVLAAGGRVNMTPSGMVEIVPPALVQTNKEDAKPSESKPAAPATTPKYPTYTVKKGDTLTRIAARQYNDGALWARLAKFNGITNSEGSVQLGATIQIPPKDVLLGKPVKNSEVVTPAPKRSAPPTRQPEPAGGGAVKPPRTELAKKDAPKADAPRNKTLAKAEPGPATYTVKKGETLGEIALKTLGSSRRWPELAEFNKLEDEDHIPAGTVLKVPPMRG